MGSLGELRLRILGEDLDADIPNPYWDYLTEDKLFFHIEREGARHVKWRHAIWSVDAIESVLYGEQEYQSATFIVADVDVGGNSVARGKFLPQDPEVAGNGTIHRTEAPTQTSAAFITYNSVDPSNPYANGVSTGLSSTATNDPFNEGVSGQGGKGNSSESNSVLNKSVDETTGQIVKKRQDDTYNYGDPSNPYATSPTGIAVPTGTANPFNAGDPGTGNSTYVSVLNQSVDETTGEID